MNTLSSPIKAPSSGLWIAGVLSCLALIPALFVLQELVVLLFLPFVFLGGFLLIQQRYPAFFAVLFAAAAVLSFDNQEGIQAREAVYYLLVLVAFSVFILPKWITGNQPIRHALDKSIHFVLAVVFYGILLGLFVSKKPAAVFEFAAFAPLATYLILRDHIHKKQVQHALFAIFLLTLAFILIRNVLNYRQIILQAVLDWEISHARAATNEPYILLGCLVTMSMFVTSVKFSSRLLWFGFFGVSFGGLLLTQSRGYWLGFFIAVVIMLLFMQAEHRKRLISYGLMGFILITPVLLFKYYEMIKTIFIVIVERFSSLGKTGKDISLQNRFLETANAMNMVKVNPIVGHGLGTTFLNYDMLKDTWNEQAYVHNGYVGLWFKFGILGLISFLSFYFLLIINAFRIVKRAVNQQLGMLGLAGMAFTIAQLQISLTSPQFYTADAIYLNCLVALFILSQLESSQTAAANPETNKVL